MFKEVLRLRSFEVHWNGYMSEISHGSGLRDNQLPHVTRG